jgi:hypothetical protein
MDDEGKAVITELRQLKVATEQL